MFEALLYGNMAGGRLEQQDQDGVVTVIAPVVGGPAARTSPRAGDQLLRIDGQPVADLLLDRSRCASVAGPAPRSA